MTINTSLCYCPLLIPLDVWAETEHLESFREEVQVWPSKCVLQPWGARKPLAQNLHLSWNKPNDTRGCHPPSLFIGQQPTLPEDVWAGCANSLLMLRARDTAWPCLCSSL